MLYDPFYHVLLNTFHFHCFWFMDLLGWPSGVTPIFHQAVTGEYIVNSHLLRQFQPVGVRRSFLILQYLLNLVGAVP